MGLCNSVKTKSKRIINPDGKIKRNLKIFAFKYLQKYVHSIFKFLVMQKWQTISFERI